LFSIIVSIVLTTVTAAPDDAQDRHIQSQETFMSAEIETPPVYSSPNYLFDNGPWYNSEGTGAGGADESILQSWGDTFGYGFQWVLDYRLADDFQVPAGSEWEVHSITFCAYQTGSTVYPTIDAMYLAVYDDVPTTGEIVAGDPFANVMTSAVWSLIYRVNFDDSGNTDRPMMACTASLPVPWVFSEGNYWLSMQADGSLSLGPWNPPVVIWDQMETGNGIQSFDGGITWTPVYNGGHAQGLTFYLEGSALTLQQETWGSIKSMF